MTCIEYSNNLIFHNINRTKLYKAYSLQENTDLVKDSVFRKLITMVVSKKWTEIKEWGGEGENIKHFFNLYLTDDNVNVSYILNKINIKANNKYSFNTTEAITMLIHFTDNGDHT